MDLFSSLKSFFKTNATTIDNNIFRLHYKVTSVVLIAFSILVTARQYIGDPIDCLSKDGFPENMLDTFCWVHTTFSLPDDWEKKVGTEVVYPGVGKYTKDIGQRRVFHAYYQWVCFVLFLQAVMFYMPRYFWKTSEGGKVKSLVLGLNSPVLPLETRMANRKLLVDYMVTNMNNHKTYFLKYSFAELLNFINVVGQMFLIDRFLGGEFSTYGADVLKFSNWDGSLRYDPMIRVFPRMTKCIYHYSGSSGDVQDLNALCILPINIINEKIYIFIWFWFIILAVLSGLALIYRYIIVFWPKSRFIITRSKVSVVDNARLDSVINKCKLGDWFLLDLLSKNLDSLNFRDVINDMAERLNNKALNDFYTHPA